MDRRPEHGYTKSILCEPNGSGKRKLNGAYLTSTHNFHFKQKKKTKTCGTNFISKLSFYSHKNAIYVLYKCVK